MAPRAASARRRSSTNRDDVCEIFCFNPVKVRQMRQAVHVVDGLAEVFKVLGDPTRTKIVYALSREELCVCDLANILGLSVPAVSHHLRLLRNLRLVRHRKEGRLVFYSLDDRHITQLIGTALEHLRE